MEVKKLYNVLLLCIDIDAYTMLINYSIHSKYIYVYITLPYLCVYIFSLEIWWLFEDKFLKHFSHVALEQMYLFNPILGGALGRICHFSIYLRLENALDVTQTGNLIRYSNQLKCTMARHLDSDLSSGTGIGIEGVGWYRWELQCT